MPAISATAPGKIILFGEHAVVYGQPAIAAPVGQVFARATVSAEIHAPAGQVTIQAPGIGFAARLDSLSDTHPLGMAVRSVLDTLHVPRPPACTLRISGNIPVASGLGSGAAVSVAIVRAFSAFLGHPLPDEQVNALAYEIEKIHHGTPSGIDNTVITYARPVYFVRGAPIETFLVRQPFELVIADTGIASPTSLSVGDVRKLWLAEPERMAALFEQVGALVRRARQVMETGDPAELGALMLANHTLLQAMTVSSPELDALVQAAVTAGALGAKLSGGGRGGNLIALPAAGQAENLAEALRQAGAVRALVTPLPPR